MRCKRHPADSSSIVGVCASCLRERLFTLIAAQAQAHQVARVQSCEDDVSRKSDSHPPPLVFPRSVSPYMSRRKSNDSAWSDHNCADRHHQRFYSTPQVGTTYSCANTAATFVAAGRKQKSRFSLWSSLFSSRSDKLESDPTSHSQDSCEPSSSLSSSGWLSSIFSSRRKKQSSRLSREDSVPSVGRKHRRRMDRGMSPAAATNADDDRNDGDRSPVESGDSSESPRKWWRSPAVAPGSAKRGTKGHSRNTSGLAFCLSPLVRASPSRHWNQKTPEMSFSGEVRVPLKPHLSTAASFCSNRSRKLADFGRTPNR